MANNLVKRVQELSVACWRITYCPAIKNDSGEIILSGPDIDAHGLTAPMASWSDFQIIIGKRSKSRFES